MQATRKARDFAQREQEILQAALSCFSGENLESVTVAQIASSVGIAKGTMYLHFAGKHEIYARLAIDFYHSLLHHLTDGNTNVTDDPIGNLVGRTFAFYLSNPNYRSITQYCEREDFRHNLSASLESEFNEIDLALKCLISGELQRGMNNGRYRILNAERTTAGLLCTIRGALSILGSKCNSGQDNLDLFISRITHYMITPLLATVTEEAREKHSLHLPAEGRQTLEPINE